MPVRIISPPQHHPIGYLIVEPGGVAAPRRQDGGGPTHERPHANQGAGVGRARTGILARSGAVLGKVQV